MTTHHRLNFSGGVRAARCFSFALTLLAIAAGAISASAAIIVNDTWRDGTDTDPASPVYSELGFDSDSDGDIESAWYQGGAGTLDPVGAGGPLRGNLTAGGTSSASWTTYFTPEWAPVNLANTGDFVRVTWVFTPTNVNVSNTSQNFRLALVDSPVTGRLIANGAPGSAAYTGYAMFMNMGQTLGNSNPFRLMRRSTTASGALLSGSGEWTALGTTGATSGNDGYDSGTEYTFDWLITRNAAAELEHVVTMTGGTLDNDGTAQVTFTDTPGAPGGFVFDTFSIRPTGATTTAELFDTRLFRVETNVITPIPEPMSLVLLGLSGFALALVRRSR